jgi:hypothetical protein
MQTFFQRLRLEASVLFCWRYGLPDCCLPSLRAMSRSRLVYCTQHAGADARDHFACDTRYRTLSRGKACCPFWASDPTFTFISRLPRWCGFGSV